MNVFVFDIETIPDINGARKIQEYQDLSDESVHQAFNLARREQSNSEFWPLHLQQIVCISAVLKTPEKVSVWSLGQEDSTEFEIIQRFFNGLTRYTPTLVSWNGSGFDCPVLHYRALVHGISAEQYWETGDKDNQFRWNNYLNRYHYRHLDLMDVMAAYNARAYAPLDHIAVLCGFPGKMGMSGAAVYDTYRQGGIKQIRNYCETDVLNTYLVYLQFELMRGHMSTEALCSAHAELRQTLESEDKAHFHEFLANWQSLDE